MEVIPWNSNTKDELRYKHLTNGVHLLMPFLGPTCHFLNLQYRLPTRSAKYRVFMMHITRCILDACWERKPSTIKNHMLEVKRNFIKCKYVGKAQLYPSLGPHPVKDLLRMGSVVGMLMRSLDLEKLSAFAKFDTFRSSQLAFSIVWKASIKGVLEGVSLGEDHRIKTLLTK